MSRQIIQTEHAPAAIGTYSQAVRVGDMLYLSGQIGLKPVEMALGEDFGEQAHQVLRNLRAVLEAADGSLDDMVKLTVYLTDLANFSKFNEIMMLYFNQPFPARAVVGVAALPRAALVEADGVALLSRG